MRRVTKKHVYWGSGSLLIVSSLITGGVLFWQAKNHNIIPKDIRVQLNFVPITAAKAENRISTPQNFKYDSSGKLLSYIQYLDGIKVTISQQPTPESFNDIPQVFDKLVEKMNSTTSFDSLNGKVYITEPKELNGGQSAVMNTKGTLIFVRPDKSLDTDTWKYYFNKFSINAS